MQYTWPPRVSTPSTGSNASCRLQAERGGTLRTAMLQAGVTPHSGRATLINCRGLGTCGTCAIEVRGPVEPHQWTTHERLRLNFLPHGPPGNQRLRLACQVRAAWPAFLDSAALVLHCWMMGAVCCCWQVGVLHENSRLSPLLPFLGAMSPAYLVPVQHPLWVCLAAARWLAKETCR